MLKNEAPVAVEKAVLQHQVDHLNSLDRDLDNIFAEIDAALDRLVNRPPRPVDDESRKPSGNAARPSIEVALNIHASSLQGLVNQAREVLTRLNRAV